MANELRYVATITDGKPIIHGRKQFDNDLKSFEGERILIKVSKYHKDKSQNQRGYYFGVVVPEILQGLVDAGYKRFQLSNDIVHRMLSDKFLTREIANEDTGEYLTVKPSTEDLNMPEYADYITECIDYAAEWLGILITAPKKQGILNFNQQKFYDQQKSNAQRRSARCAKAGS